ncbi:MAG: RluA family pseudouridine synthase [Chitinophagaceae bacterium]|nr:RluA family pseudouridine synthase [Chitinophagaceae bacterium]
MGDSSIVNDELFDDDEITDEAPAERRLVLDLVIDGGQEPLRIDKFIQNRMGSSTRNKIQQGIEDGDVLINGKPVKANYKVRPGDVLHIYSFKPPESQEIIPENIPLDIVYEDDDVIVLNKPAGMVVHPGVGNYSGTVVNALSYYLQEKGSTSAELPRVGLVHRIDKDTTGLLVVGKTEKAMYGLAEQFKAHTVDRRYTALVWGDVEEEEGTIRTNIARHTRFRKLFDTYEYEGEIGKTAVTHYRVLERFNYVTLVQCELETGRTHQIRVHMRSIGHTLFGDKTYGGDSILKGTVFSKYKQFVENCFALLPRQALHAQTLGFTHPITGERLFFEQALPADLTAVLDKWHTYVKAKKLND